MTRGRGAALGSGLLLAVALELPAPSHGAPVPAPPQTHAAAVTSPAAVALERIQARYAQLLVRHRPDLAERYGATPTSVKFVPLDEATAPAHMRALRLLLAEADTLPAEARADSLRARLRREIDETREGGELWRDPLLWLDVVAAAARAPFATGTATGCDRTRRGTLQLLTLPDALRGAAILLRGAPAPDPAAFEARVTSLERLLRRELPDRTEPCKESRRRAEFVEADSLAAASLAQFRLWVGAHD